MCCGLYLDLLFQKIHKRISSTFTFVFSEIYDVSFLDLDPFPLQEKLRRNSLKMDVPEKILSQAHGKVRTVADFLHENGK